MKNRKHTDKRHIGYLFAGITFFAPFVFFLTAYPYHLIRREQMNLFVYDWDYIVGRFNGLGWLSRFAGSFVEQFFCVRVLGPLVVSLLLVAIGTVTYRIFRKFLGEGISIAIASLMVIWSFFRECDVLYMTRYTIVTLGFLSLVLLALQFKKIRGKVLAVVLFLCFGVWALGVPYNSVSGKLWATPNFKFERLIAMNTELARENWDRVIKLSEKDLHTVDASLCYNLAQAMKGQLGNKLLDHSQSSDPYFFLPSVSGDHNLYTNCLIGELWYQLGDLTIAEQSAITSLQASPEHTGARYIERLARVNIITGQKITSQKYLDLLKNTLFYGKWARRMLYGSLTEEDKSWIERGRANMPVSDIVPLSDIIHSLLSCLLEANPDNIPAREYMLCFDLLRYDLGQFIEDYKMCKLDSHIYKEAVVIWLGQHGATTQDVVDEYGIDDSVRQRMESFFRYPHNYRNTYWYYYQKAIQDSNL